MYGAQLLSWWHGQLTFVHSEMKLNQLLIAVLFGLACLFSVVRAQEVVDDDDSLPSPTTIFFTAPPGEAPVIIHSVGFTSGSVSPYTSSPTPSGPFVAPGVIVALILGIIGAWLLCLLLCFIIILAVTMSGGGGKFDSTVRT